MMAGRSTATVTKEEIQAGIIDSDTVTGQFSGLVVNSAPVDGVDEIQTWTKTGTPTGGTFTATYNGVTSAAIAYNASAAAVQAALEAMSSIGTGNVTVSGSAGGPFTVTFVGQLAGKPIGALTLAHAFTGGSTPDIGSEVDTAGVTGTYRGTAAPAALLHRTDTPTLYLNTGSLYKPEWSALALA